MGQNKYLKMKSDIHPYYYANDFLLNVGLNSFVKLNSIQQDVVLSSDGRSYEEVYRYIIERYEQEDNEETKNVFKKLVNNLCEEGFIEQLPIENCEAMKCMGEQGRTYPWWLIVELTSMCNMRCRHCYRDAKEKGTMLEFKIFEDIIEAFKNKTPKIVLTGGEPLLHPRINDMLSMAVENFDTYVLTNASLLENINVQNLKQIKQLQISLYGYNDLFFSDFTGQNLYDRTIKNIERAVGYLGEKVVVTVIITKKNVNNLEEYISKLISLGVSSMMFSLSVPIGRMGEYKQEFSFEKDELMMLLNEINEYREKYRGKIQIAPFMDISKIKIRNSSNFGCQAGKYNVAITEKGMVVPCHMMSRDAFPKYWYEDYIKDVMNGNQKNYIDSVNRIGDILKQSNSEFGEIYCNGFCDVGR